MSAVMAGMSSQDLEEGMDLAAIAGQPLVAGDMVASLDRPMQASFLEDRAERLREIAAETTCKSWAELDHRSYLKYN